MLKQTLSMILAFYKPNNMSTLPFLGVSVLYLLNHCYNSLDFSVLHNLPHFPFPYITMIKNCLLKNQGVYSDIALFSVNTFIFISFAYFPMYLRLNFPKCSI